MRNNPKETYIKNGIEKDDITNSIRAEENNNNKKIADWDKYEHRKFNKELWERTRQMLHKKQKEEFPKTNKETGNDMNKEKTNEEIKEEKEHMKRKEK